MLYFNYDTDNRIKEKFSREEMLKGKTLRCPQRERVCNCYEVTLDNKYQDFIPFIRELRDILEEIKAKIAVVQERVRLKGRYLTKKADD